MSERALCVWCGESEDNEAGELVWYEDQLYHRGCLGRGQQLSGEVLDPRPRRQADVLDRSMLRKVASRPHSGDT